MAKPIFLVALPYLASPDQIECIQQSLSNRLTDYHTIVYTHDKDETEFRAIYEKDFDKVEFQELKDLIETATS